MEKVCLAYVGCGNTPTGKFDEQIKKINMKKLTHMAVAFLTFSEVNGKWMPYLSPLLKSNIKRIKEEIAAQHADTKLLLSVGGAGADGFCQATRTASGRKETAKILTNIVDELSVDGIDIDWEFPGEPILGIACCKNCKTDFVLFLEELKKQLKSHLLTIAVGSNRYFGLDVKRIGKAVDYVFVMTYDLGLMHSNFFLSTAFINMWHLFGIPYDKLCIGVPIYGRNVKNLEKDMGFKNLSKGKITHFLGQSYSDYDGEKWCFDTEDDIKKKAVWAQKRNLGGIFCWEITNDDNNRILNSMCF